MKKLIAVVILSLVFVPMAEAAYPTNRPRPEVCFELGAFKYCMTVPQPCTINIPGFYCR